MPSFMDSDEEKLYRPLREYSRVDACLPVRIRAVPEEERQNVRSHITYESLVTQFAEMPEPEDRVLAECLQILNAKLDSILRMLAQSDKNGNGLDLVQVNISGGGLSMRTAESFPVGQLVEIRLVLPIAPLNVFYLYGVVVKCDEACGMFQTYVEFTIIEEDIREQIAKYVFNRQREVLRKKRRP